MKLKYLCMCFQKKCIESKMFFFILMIKKNIQKVKKAKTYAYEISKMVAHSQI